MLLSPSRNPRHREVDPKRLHLQNIAEGTIKALNDGYIDMPDATSNMRRYNIAQYTDDTVRGTQYYNPESARLKWWKQGPRGPPFAIADEHHGDRPNIAVDIRKMSTLQGAHLFSQTYPASKIGVLNFASATKPGGGFINGASAQEESIARSSTLFMSLRTRQAGPFYASHARDNQRGLYSHAMIHSPAVTIFRDDDGRWIDPYHVDVVTSPAVNAGLVRKLRWYGRKSETEKKILSEMKERMGRILALFELAGIRHLVLGSFGTGVFQNEVSPLAEIWGELLAAPGARYANSFDQVLFAIPDTYTSRQFRTGYNAAVRPSRTWFPRL